MDSFWQKWNFHWKVEGKTNKKHDCIIDQKIIPINTNKSGTSEVGAKSKAQKAQRF